MTLGLILLALAAAPAVAGELDSFAKHWRTGAEFSMAVAEAMPAESYNFAPNPEEMGFGMLMIHYAQYNNMGFANASGLKAPQTPEKITAAYKAKGPFDKATVIQFLKDSFAFCDKAMSEITQAKLDQVAGPEKRQAEGREWLWRVYTHMIHHRGQAEVYLRVKDIKPPQYRF
ncbi:MAG: DinB family protein [Bryobacteraceae bacterium]